MMWGMMYVPSFFEAFVVLVAAVAVLFWVQKRSARAGVAIPILVGWVTLPVLWGAVSLWTSDLDSVLPARYTTMAVALLGLVGSIGWAISVRDQPRLDAPED